MRAMHQPTFLRALSSHTTCTSVTGLTGYTPKNAHITLTNHHPASLQSFTSSKAQQLADMKAMFERGLIPSREIYEDKVRQILGLS